jgi:hypothetical protein
MNTEAYPYDPEQTNRMTNSRSEYKAMPNFVYMGTAISV